MFKFAGCLLQCFDYVFSLVCPKFEEFKQRSKAGSFSAVITAADYTLRSGAHRLSTSLKYFDITVRLFLPVVTLSSISDPHLLPTSYLNTFFFSLPAIYVVLLFP